MEYLFVSIKIIAALFVLIILPGMFFLSLLRERIHNIDSYEIISFSLMCGLAFWIPLSWGSYAFNVSSNSPIYASLFLTGLLAFCVFYKNRFHLSHLLTPNSKWHLGRFFNIYVLIIIIESIMVGYTSQYQAGNSDALAHVASIRNVATLGTIQNCDWVLGEGAPIQAGYGCNPWYLILGMIVNFSQVDAALVYSPITGVIYFLSVLSIYTLLKAISGDVFLSKIGSLVFTFVSLLSWLIENKNGTYNLLSNWIIFPQAMVDYILFPITLAIFTRYILKREKSFLALTILCLLVITKFHPNWLVWGPIVISGVIIFRNIFIGKFGIKNVINYKIIFIGVPVFLLSALSFLFCKNTFMNDQTLISPLDLWRVSGGNLLYFSEHIFLYNPLGYIKSRGLFDLMTIGLFGYLYKQFKENYNELMVIYSGILAVIFFIAFNPIIVFLMVKIGNSSIPLYRAFHIFWPALSAFTIYSVLALLKLQYKKFPFMVLSVIFIAINFSLLFTNKYEPFLKAVYENQGNYYSVNKDLYLEPFSTLKTLDYGKIAVRTPLATAIAALTNLDPITTEKFRSRSLNDWSINEQENDSLLLFNKPYDELLAIIHKRKIHYIVINSSDLYSINNFKKYPELINFKVFAGDDEVWEIKQDL